MTEAKNEEKKESGKAGTWRDLFFFFFFILVSFLCIARDSTQEVVHLNSQSPCTFCRGCQTAGWWLLPLQLVLESGLPWAVICQDLNCIKQGPESYSPPNKKVRGIAKRLDENDTKIHNSSQEFQRRIQTCSRRWSNQGGRLGWTEALLFQSLGKAISVPLAHSLLCWLTCSVVEGQRTILGFMCVCNGIETKQLPGS